MFCKHHNSMHQTQIVRRKSKEGSMTDVNGKEQRREQQAVCTQSPPRAAPFPFHWLENVFVLLYSILQCSIASAYLIKYVDFTS